MKWTAAELENLPQISMWVPGHRLPHPTIRLGDTDIDEELAPVVAALWERGLATAACCQGDPFEYHISMGAHGEAYILFSDFDQAVQFLRTAAAAITHNQGIYKIRLHPMAPLDGSAQRASVTFPPLLIEAITAAWLDVSQLDETG